MISFRKSMILPILAVISLILINIRIGATLLGYAMPNTVVFMGLFLPIVITVIITVKMIDKIYFGGHYDSRH